MIPEFSNDFSLGHEYTLMGDKMGGHHVGEVREISKEQAEEFFNKAVEGTAIMYDFELKNLETVLN